MVWNNDLYLPTYAVVLKNSGNRGSKSFGVAYPQWASSILYEFRTDFWELIISLTPKHKGFFDKKQDNDDAWHLESQSFIVGEATSSWLSLSF
jgi:hypothetical protein